MKQFLSRLAIIGVVAASALGAGVLTSSAQNCGGTDCQDMQRNGPGYSQNWRDGRHWRGDDRHWRGGRHWRDDRRWRHHYRPRSGIYFGFGSIPYYDYRYARPAPRYYARPGYLSPAHIQWCYDHYRTYRQSDNTYKPTRYTRAQCQSPYY